MYICLKLLSINYSKTKVVTRLSFTKILASLLTNIIGQQEVKPPPEQFNSTLENPIQILMSVDTLYKLPSKVTYPLLGLLFLRALSCRLCWDCLLSMCSHGAVADGQQTPELLVFNLHQERDVLHEHTKAEIISWWIMIKPLPRAVPVALLQSSTAGHPSAWPDALLDPFHRSAPTGLEPPGIKVYFRCYSACFLNMTNL